jgi:TonB-linked SusC/RagA family outer membrane protein
MHLSLPDGVLQLFINQIHNKTMRKKPFPSIFPWKCLKKTFLIMKLTTLFALLTTLQMSANMYSQNSRVTMNVSNGTLSDVFKEIEKQTEYKIFYKVDQINLQARLNVTANEMTVSDVLGKVLPENGATYDVIDKIIVITPASRQSLKITGVIVDSKGQPMPGVSVSLKGTSVGSITDTDGKYSVEVPDGNAVLVFSFMGFLPEERQVGTQTTINLNMIEDIKQLEEVVVVGYGTVKKSDVTGALTRVSQKTLEERPVQNAIQAMQGKAAGVDIVSNARPGEMASITIRGNHSFKDKANDPLYVVDGIILMGNINDINPNDISNIEILKDASATAIYGARGSNGVVLITTKKGSKGQVSVKYDATLTFDNIHSLTDWASAGESLDRYRLADINGGTYKGTGNALKYPDPAVDITRFGNNDLYTINAIRKGYEWNDPGVYSSVKLRDATAEEIANGWPAQVPVYNSGSIPSTDWVKLLTQTSVTQNHLLSFTSGSDNSALYLSVGYLNNEGTQKNQGYTRYTTKFNGDISPLKWFKVGASVNASFSKQKYGTINRSGSATGPQDMYGMALSQYRMSQPYDTTGGLNTLILYPGNNKAAPVWNPLIDLNNTNDERRIMNIMANLYAEVKITPWLKYRMNFGSGFRYQRNGAFQGSQSTLRRTANPPTASATYSTNDNFQYMLENLLYFDKTIGPHTFGLTLLQSVQDNRTENSYINASKITYDTYEWYNQSANLNGMPDGYGTGFTENSLMSYMGRFNYTLLNRYLLTATGRFDGASVLAPGHKWEFFPSFALAWKMQEEKFLKPIKWISELKLRTGYGVVGNSAVPAYSTSGPLSQYNYVFNNGSDIPSISFIPYNVANPSLKWERSAQINIGLDFGLFTNRITGSAEIYEINTTDNLMDRNLPAYAGYPVVTSNIGKVRNRGIEISLSTINIQTQNFRWSTDINWTKNKEEIISLVNGKQDMAGNGWFIGQPIQDMRPFRQYQVDGLWQDTPDDLAQIALWKANNYTFAPGQYKPVEQGVPNYKLEDNDKIIKGSPRPKWVGGLTNTFAYKNFELSAFIYFRIGQSYFSSLQPGGSTGGSFVGYVRHVDPNDFWSPANTGAKWPQPTTATTNINGDVLRSTYINDGSFAIVRNIALSYSLPSKFINRFKIKNFQVYGQVLNPFIFGGEVLKAGINPDDPTGWTSFNSNGDPTGGANNNTMIIRSYVLGVRVTF